MDLNNETKIKIKSGDEPLYNNVNYTSITEHLAMERF
jgi:hypothetical protein